MVGYGLCVLSVEEQARTRQSSPVERWCSRLYKNDRGSSVKERALSDDDEPITFNWVASNFPSMGPQYSARQHRDCPQLVWLNRFERFTLYDNPQTHLKTRGDVRRLVSALGCKLKLDRPEQNYKQCEYWV